jgi:DNA-binding transcriptional MerR regulator
MSKVKNFQKRMDTLKKVFEQTYSPKEVKDVVGLSRRQISEWDSKGILPNQEVDSDKKWHWRRFTGADIVKLCVLKELRDAGIQPIDLLQLVVWFKDNDKEIMGEIIEEIARGSDIFLSTNLKDKFFLVPTSRKEIKHAIFLSHHESEKDTKISMRINIKLIVDTMLEKLDKKLERTIK